MLVGVLKRNHLGLIYTFLKVSIAHLYDNLESGKRNILNCFGNLEFWEPKICTKRWKEDNELQMSLSNPNLFDKTRQDKTMFYLESCTVLCISTLSK